MKSKELQGHVIVRCAYVSNWKTEQKARFSVYYGKLAVLAIPELTQNRTEQNLFAK